MVNHSKHRFRAGEGEGGITTQQFSTVFIHIHGLRHGLRVLQKYQAILQESDAAPIRASVFRVRAVMAQRVPRRVWDKAHACAAFRTGSLMIPTTLGHSWK